MKESVEVGAIALPRDAHLLEPIFDWERRQPDRVIGGYREGDRFVDVTAAQRADDVRAVGKGLIALGVQPGERVAIMSHTRWEWVVLDYGILAAGGVTVPIYETSSDEQIHWILSDSGAVAAFFETEDMLRRFEAMRDRLPDVRHAFVIEAGIMDDLTARGAEVADQDLEGRVAGITTDDLATIIYTSGTTGRPKGCILTHGNLRVNVKQSLEAVEGMLRDDDSSLLFLPLAHAMAKIITLVCVEAGIASYIASDVSRVVEELPMVRPTMVVSVPRIFEKVFNGAQHKAHSEGKGAIFERSADVAVRYSRETCEGRPKLRTRAVHGLFDRLVYGKIRAVFGGRLRFAFSGGGPLGERLTHFFNGIGVQIFEAYGLTETSPVLTLNGEGKWHPGTVGRPVAGTTIEIADDGEILAKGPQVFGGYWHNEAATSETFRDGWFLTGDIGEIDEDGYVRITGRKKDLLVTAAGKNVAPAPLEDRLRAHPLVSQALVVGDAKPFVSALVTLDEEAFETWAAEHGKPGATFADMLDDPELNAEIQRAVDRANEPVSRPESIRKFVILPEDLSIEGGELTPTLKIKRDVVLKGYGHLVDELYAA